MADVPHIVDSACRHGISFYDVQSVRLAPERVISMVDLAGIGMGESERPKVVVYAGYDVAGEPSVVNVDRFEGVAFHSEPGHRNYRWLF